MKNRLSVFIFIQSPLLDSVSQFNMALDGLLRGCATILANTQENEGEITILLWINNGHVPIPKTGIIEGGHHVLFSVGCSYGMTGQVQLLQTDRPCLWNLNLTRLWRPYLYQCCAINCFLIFYHRVCVPPAI